MSDQQRRPGLGPHLIGQRVVVRRIVRGENGPSGGPALTDLLGVMESWASGVTTVRAESGQVTAILVDDIVSGKPVPPRPSPRQRVSAKEAELRATLSWPPLVTSPLGEWLLRASRGYTARANSVLAVGEPGLPFESAVEKVRDFYAAHDLPAWAQVVVDSETHHGFESAGWMPARPAEADTVFQIGSVSMALRSVRRGAPAVRRSVVTGSTAGPDWLADDEDALAHGQPALDVLEGPDEVAFASLTAGPEQRAEGPVGTVGAGGVIAKGRAAYARDWCGISNIWVSPSHRREGLAVDVIGALLEWGAQRGASTAYLQTRGDNPGALALYARLGFVAHHTYRYLRSPG
ncbi:MAG TPA: GNAT family N-acetyltransferase [Nocardioidaceae bacterium]|nr:GNAT family N-acetyltransferase [Nocardioidaceae bacterium]